MAGRRHRPSLTEFHAAARSTKLHTSLACSTDVPGYESMTIQPRPSSAQNGRVQWSGWQPLQGCFRPGTVPDEPGLYKIRRSGRDDVDYIGQTGIGLRGRLAMLRGVYTNRMPYRDPHTAGPGLWALRDASRCAFEASVAVAATDVHVRKGLEALEIALYRQHRGCSPILNFGGMPAGYRMSSGNNARLAAAGNRRHGGRSRTATTCESLCPIGPLVGDPHGSMWCGHEWTKWESISNCAKALDADSCGVYRVRAAGAPGLVYIGEGCITARLTAHLRKVATKDHPQAQFFAAKNLECSWVVSDVWQRRQRCELETDLIGAHCLAIGAPPAAQFRG